MELHRGYAQPSSPDAHRQCAENADHPTLPYSTQLKNACKAGAGPRPKKPQTCPRCGVAAQFKTTLCYKLGIAGAWNVFVSSLLAFFLLFPDWRALLVLRL